MKFNNQKVKKCPFCGDNPSIETRGTCIDIECCASMSFQKSDYLTREERNYWQDTPYYRYTPELEAKVLKEVLKVWNTRV